MNNTLLKNVSFVILATVVSVVVFTLASEDARNINTTQTETVRDGQAYAVKYTERANVYARCSAVYHTMNHVMNDKGLDDLALGAFHTCIVYTTGANIDGAGLGTPGKYCESSFEASLTEFTNYDKETLVSTFEKESPICSDSLDVQVEIMKAKNIPVPTSASEYTDDCPARGESGYGEVC